jgi:hemerythrin-like domain-containing protein
LENVLINAEGRLRFDGREMLMVHDVFRREFALMPALVRGVAVGDRSRAQIVIDHIEFVSTVLHHHHSAEDQYTWPLLLDRCGPAFAAVVEVMEVQHRHIAALGGEVDAAKLAAQAFAEHSLRIHGTPTPPRSTEI